MRALKSQQTARPMRPFDLAFLFAETHAQPQHVGALLIFDAPPATAGFAPADLVAAYRAAAAAEPFGRLAKLPRVGAPHWAECAALDMAYHVQHLGVPAPGGVAQLVELVQELHSATLDRGQPLFRVWVIEGLADGGFALYAKMHHALVDGISALMRIVASLSADPEAAAGAPFFAAMPQAKAAKAARAFDLKRTAQAIAEQARSVGDLSIATIGKLVAAVAGTHATNTPFAAPATPINQPIRNGRALALASLPLAALRDIGQAAGGTINDAVLAVVDCAVSRYLDERGAASARPLVAMVPVSLRAKGDTKAATQASAILTQLGDPAGAPHDRLAQIIERADRAKAAVRAMSEQGAKNHALALYLLAEGLGSLGIERPCANVVVSNVPGPQGDLYLGGARLRGLFPVSIVSTRMGLNVTLVSQGGRMHVGLLADRNQLPDPERIAALAQEALDQLLKGQARQKPAKSARLMPSRPG